MSVLKYFGINFPKLTLAIVFGTTAFFFSQLPDLIVDTNTMFLTKDHPARHRFENVQNDFTGMNDSIMVVVSKPEEGMFNPEGLAVVKELTDKLREMNFIHAINEEKLKSLIPRLPNDKQQILEKIIKGGVGKEDYADLTTLKRDMSSFSDEHVKYGLRDVVAKIQPIRKVTSIIDIEEVFPDDDVFVVADFVKDMPKTKVEADAIHQRAVSNPMLYKSLVSDDGKSIAIRVEGRIEPDDAVNMRLLYDEVNSLVSTDRYKKYEIYLAGLPVMAAASAAVAEHDTGMYFPVVILVVLSIVLIYLRSASRIVVPLLVVILSILWSLGLMALLDVKQNIISSMLPVFLISIGIVDSIHMISEYDNHIRGGKNHKNALIAMMDNEFSPVIMTSVTSAIAFIFLAWTKIIYIRDFGYFVAFGIMAAMLLSLYFIPAMIALIKPKMGSTKNNTKGFGLLFSCMRRGMVCMTKAMIHHRRKGLTVLIAIFAMGVFFASNISIDNQSVSYFPKGSEIRVSDAYVNGHYGGTIPLNVILMAKNSGAFYDPKNLKIIELLQKKAIQLLHVGYSISLADYIKRINYKFHNENQAFYRLPQTVEEVGIPSSYESRVTSQKVQGAEQVAQYALMYETAGGNTLWDVVSKDFSRANIVFMVKTDRATTLEKVKHEIAVYANEIGLSGLSLSFGGYGDLLEETVHEITEGQVQSLILTIPVMFLILLVMFKRVGYALAGIVPFISTLLIMFSIMAIGGVDVNIGTSILASIAIGTGVDFAIHYISRYRDARSDGSNEVDACVSAAELSGPPIFMGSLSIAAGFLVLLLSDFQGVSSLGWLVAVTMLLSMLTTLLFMPVLMTFRIGK